MLATILEIILLVEFSFSILLVFVNRRQDTRYEKRRMEEIEKLRISIDNHRNELVQQNKALEHLVSKCFKEG